MSEDAGRNLETRESGLTRGLTRAQLTMIGIGGAIGTGLFMGSGMAVGYAGPAVVVSYLIAALVAFIVMVSLAEMAVAHPIAGSFGSFAEAYIAPRAGFVVRVTYWATMVILIGSEAIAIANYMSFWMPDLPRWVAILVSGVVIAVVNTRPVENFGSVEYWLSVVKVTAILVFILFGAARIFGIGSPGVGFSNYFVDGGPMPNGVGGVWMGVVVALFSFLGIEMIAVAAGEAQDPQRAVPAAMRTMLLRLLLFYVLAIGVMVALVPWTQSGGEDIRQGPFVRLFADYGFALAADVMNFVVLTAALSAMNSSLFMATRMVFSLARSGEAPAGLAAINRHGVPGRAVLISCLGVLIAALIAWLSPSAFQYLMGISLFGGLFTWIMILIAHLRFRVQAGNAAHTFRAPFHPWLQGVGLALLIGVAVAMVMAGGFWRTAVFVGIGWLALVTLGFALKNDRS